MADFDPPNVDDYPPKQRFTKRKHYTGHELYQLNMCRQEIRATTISDLATPDLKQLRQEFLELRVECDSDFRW